MTRARATLLVVLVLAVLFGPAAGVAAAHSFVVSIDPPDGARLAAGPARVTFTFNEPIQPGFDTVTVVGPEGRLWSDGTTAVQGADVSVAVRPLGAAGVYTIAYRVISADGHPVAGTRHFTLTVAGRGTPGPPAAGAGGPAAGPAAADAGGGPGWGWIGGGVALVFVVGLGLATLGSRSRRRLSSR